MRGSGSETADGRPAGFDAPVMRREDDHLNRWSLARQVYRVAVDGPSEWCARVGVYGEWGTGKTSVLRFVEAMAEKDDHIVVWFDPWAFRDSAEVWRNFVERVSSAIGSAAEEPQFGLGAKLKSFGARARDYVQEKLKKSSGEVAGAVAIGTDILTGWLRFGAEDLRNLRVYLKGRRLLVFIDDLDRTEAELVPEILYALKQVMDLPGFSFVCGFDPQVVGKVLRSRHKGFGDGLRFLEKIIDYPVWLPPPSREGLRNIAVADAKRYAPFVPQEELEPVLDLLSENPRSVRQFIRLLSLIRDQVERYDDGDLNWRVILVANAIQARFPKIKAQSLHRDEFYRESGYSIFSGDRHSNAEKRKERIKKHVVECWRADVSGKPSEVDVELIANAMQRLCEETDVWLGSGTKGVVEQCLLSLNSPIVTKKEFCELTNLRKGKRAAENSRIWIAGHADRHGFSAEEVTQALIPHTLSSFCYELKRADGAYTEKGKTNHQAKAKLLLKLLKHLLLKPTKFCDAMHHPHWVPVESMLRDLLPFADSGSTCQRDLWPRIEELLVAFVKGWKGEVANLADAIRSFGAWHRNGGLLRGKPSQNAAKKLNELVDLHLAEIIRNGFNRRGFINAVAYNHDGHQHLNRLFLDHSGVLWREERHRLLESLRRAGKSSIGRENAYALIEWLNYLLRDGDQFERAKAVPIAKDPEVCQTLWAVATSKPFRGRLAFMIRDFPKNLAAEGTDIVEPDWWRPAIDETVAEIELEAAIRQGRLARPDTESSKTNEVPADGGL